MSILEFDETGAIGVGPDVSMGISIVAETETVNGGVRVGTDVFSGTEVTVLVETAEEIVPFERAVDTGVDPKRMSNFSPG